MATGKGTWEPRSVYLYIVCLITLVMVLLSVVNIVRASVELIYPEPRRVMQAIKVPPAPSGEESPEIRQTPEEEQEWQRQWSLRRAILNLAGSVGMLLSERVV
jgi:hypothetical protein